MHSGLSRISVIIPVWHEAARINELIAHVRHAGRDEQLEIIVSDGAPQRDTLAAIKDTEVIRVRAPQGRAVQMNAGAHTASGDILVFLHADTALPPDAFAAMRQGLEILGEKGGAGAFRLGIEGARGFLYAVERLSNWRNRLTRTPYGDQVQFFKTSYYRLLGGYSAIPIMEDVDIMRRIRQRGDVLALLPQKVRTSARRWQAEGVLYCSLRNVCLRTLYALGVPAQTLSRWYLAYKGKS
ncbi:TIGR04283 family arsenosugar biosynthesis glycosyltransferase [Desulfovibrio mangrovi]|uniref:TIGR04283 family arsenosugar biosynthesis glycosyltransferase n=1 Tax=Desulfovibrio mangrovi TaxID=2976983 RepID=UPI0022455EF4|nr:TIGR04283 family arsenosugar biosynthesis glycosyltransferase [Desulfovibrio mangrovi]UZP65917.1 TIGR04283 family arsenosugar biosynthesis glycosyltransferase [Desulfovibrio mangrovi]